MYDLSLSQESNNGLAPPIIRAEEVIVTKYKAHVDHYSNMREYIKGLIVLSKQNTRL